MKGGCVLDILGWVIALGALVLLLTLTVAAGRSQMNKSLRPPRTVEFRQYQDDAYRYHPDADSVVDASPNPPDLYGRW